MIDVQNAAVDGGYQRDAVVANIGGLSTGRGGEQVPVIWVQHSDEGSRREARLADRPRTDSG